MDGAWNGVGGKIEKNVTPLAGALRDIIDEQPSHWRILPSKDWWDNPLRLYVCFIAELPETYLYVPIKVAEGILDIMETSSQNAQKKLDAISYYEYTFTYKKVNWWTLPLLY